MTSTSVGGGAPRAHLRGKTILVTGGTGSFGHAFVSSVIDSDVREIRILSRDELKQEEMRIRVNDRRVRFFLGDVRDPDSVEGAMVGVDLVFHAAALKQVPSCEFFPMQAVRTNILGSENVVRSAIARGVKSVVCLSTDKAAYPINAMGMSKALMERVAQSYARRPESAGTVVSCVRYGNVMCSRGSVIPLFLKQIRAGQPITLTVPEMTRFMLPLADSVGLVLFALEHARPGDLFVKKAPACTVEDLAQALKNIFRSDVPTRIIGIRHGEKMYETLVTREEMQTAEDLGDYFRIPIDERDLNYSSYFVQGRGTDVPGEGYTSANTERLDVEETEALLRSLPAIRSELERFGAQA